MEKILSNVSEIESNEDRDYGYFLLEKNEKEYEIELEERYVYIPDLDIRVHHGYCMDYNTDTDQYDELSCDVYAVFDINKGEFVNVVTNCNICECIKSYISSKKNIDISIDNIDKLKCEINYI